MKKLLHLSFFILSSFNMLFSQNLAVQNPSFEGPTGPHITPPLWGICMPGQTPDTQPGSWGINLPPTDGNSYLGMVHQQPSWQEGASQQLLNEITGNAETMQAGVVYQFDIDISDYPIVNQNFLGPSELLVWGGFSDCSQTELLWSSGDVPNYVWTTYTVSFTPTMNFSHIMFQCNGLNSANGSILIDNMSSITPPCDTPQTSLVPSNFNGYNISCNSYNDGSIDLTVTGDSLLGYTYLWNNNATTEDITNLSAGIYSVDITDSNSCTTSISFTLTEPPLFQTTIYASTDYNGYPISCNGYSDGGIDLSVSGSVPGYTYLWDNGDTTQTISGLSAGIYSVDITDSNTCTASTSISLIEPTLLETTFILSDINGYNLCNDSQDGFIDLSVSGSVPVYSYQWSNGDTTEGLDSLGAGFYYYTVTDQNGCTTSDTIEITEPILNIQESVTDVSCFGGINGAVSVIVSGSTAPYYVFWDNNINPSLLSEGTYGYQIIDSIGCSYNDSLIVSDPDSFVVVENITNVSCYGFNDGKILLDITGSTPPYIVDWFGFSTINMSTGTYNFTILDSNNCAYSEIAIVSEPNPIDVLNQVVDPSCGNTNDGSVSLIISGGTPLYSVDWGGSNPNSLALGTYDFVIIDDNNCIDSNSVTLIAESNIQVISSVTKISCNSFCDGAIDLQINGGVAPYTVDWFGFNSAALCEGNVSYDLIDAFGCSYSESFLMLPPDSVELIIDQIGMQLQATANGGVSPYSYEWFNDLGSLANSQNVNITSNGNYYCIAIDTNHCQSDTITYFYSETSINNSEVYDFNIYPNPTNNYLNIEFESIIEQNYSVYLVDLLGEKILLDRIDKYKGNYSYKLNLFEFAQGIYILELKSENKIYNKKIIKK